MHRELEAYRNAELLLFKQEDNGKQLSEVSALMLESLLGDGFNVNLQRLLQNNILRPINGSRFSLAKLDFKLIDSILSECLTIINNEKESLQSKLYFRDISGKQCKIESNFYETEIKAIREVKRFINNPIEIYSNYKFFTSTLDQQVINRLGDYGLVRNNLLRKPDGITTILILEAVYNFLDKRTSFWKSLREKINDEDGLLRTTESYYV